MLAAPDDSAQVPPSWRGGLRLEELLALGAISACLLAELALLPVGLDDMDEGYFMEQASRVLRGELPYRDFDSLYTPGLLYLHAVLFSVLGDTHVLAPRLLSFLTRVALAFALYALARPLARPFWAALPALYLLLGLDRAPLNWEPHPGWQSMLWTVVAVWLLAHLPTLTGRRQAGCLAVVGLLTALVFVHKQNAGAFLGLAASGFLLLQGVDLRGASVTPAVRALQLLALGAVLGGLGWLLHPHPYADLLMFAYLLGPVAGAGLLLMLSGSVAWRGQGLLVRLAPLPPLAAGFALGTLPWVAALVVALGGQAEHLRGFVGGVDVTPLALPMELPTSTAWTAVLGLGVTAIAAVRAGRYTRLVPLLLMASFGAAMVQLTREPAESLTSALLLAPGRAGIGLQAFLPTLALASGLWLARRVPRSAAEWRLRWYVAAGAVTFLTQYPRLDNHHLLWSACLPLVVGAIALDRLHSWLGRRWQSGRFGRTGLAAALLVVPILTAVPTLYIRGEGLLKVDADTGVIQYAPLARIDGVPSVGGVLVPEADRDQLVGVTSYLRSTTQKDEPLFVYPTSPLLYVAAERPNPTRYSHLYPDAASPVELERLQATLESAEVRTVVVSDGWLFVWQPPGNNAPLEEYLVSRYEQTARFGTYRVLKRGNVEVRRAAGSQQLRHPVDNRPR